MTYRVTIVGIDGSGKSTVIEELPRLLGLGDDAAALHCPDFHDSPGVPLHDLSLHLRAIGESADRAGDPVTKAATLFLRMTLFGPAERFLIEERAPRLLVCERHPIVETSVYAPVYERLAADASERGDRLPDVLADAERRSPGAAAALREWQTVVSARTGIAADLNSVIGDVVDVLAAGTGRATARLAEIFGTTMPDLVLWLDAEPALCARRCAERARQEIHEDLPTLTVLRGRYAAVTAAMADACPGTRIERLAVPPAISPAAFAERAAAIIEDAVESTTGDGAAGGDSAAGEADTPPAGHDLIGVRT